MAGCKRHVVGHHRLSEASERKLANLFHRYCLFDRDGNRLSEKDLSILGLSAQPRGEIANSANGGIAGPLCEADLAEGRVALRDTSAEPKHAATSSTPGSYQSTGRLA